MEPNESGCGREIAEAIRAVREGDVQAYATIVERFQGPLMTFCTAMLRDRQAAEELAQDTLVRAYERLDAFDASRPMKPWLFRIAHRLAQQGWRTRRRERARRVVIAGAVDRDRGEPGPAEKLLAHERSERLWEAVSRLPMAQRTAVVLYYREGQTVDQVAETMEISPGTVKTHLLRARARIHAELTGSPSDAGELP